VWDAATGHQLSEPLRHGGSVSYAEFSPEGRRVLTCSRDGTAKIWPVLIAPVPVPDWLPKLAEAVAGERMDREGQSHSVSVEDLHQLRRERTASQGTRCYERWARWFFEGGATRSDVPMAHAPSAPSP
jgi:hypothetical protein